MHTARRACVCILAATLSWSLVSCGKRVENAPSPPTESEPTTAAQPPSAPPTAQSDPHPELTESLILRLTDPSRPGLAATEAISWLTAGLRSEPASPRLLQRLHAWLTNTVWQVPVLRLPHPGTVDLVDAAGVETLWVALAGEAHAVARWDLRTCQPVAIGLVAPQASTTFWKRDSTGRRVVLGRAGMRLLGDAQSLKPICVLDHAVGGESLTAFSADGLLLAHPAEPTAEVVRTKQAPLHWVIRDALSGTVLRQEQADLPLGRVPLAAQITRTALHVRLDDGSCWNLPVAPVEPPTLTESAAAETGVWLAAWYPTLGPLAGQGWCGVFAANRHQPGEWRESLQGRSSPWVPDLRQLLAESPWSRRECLWNGPPAGAGPLRLVVHGSSAVAGLGAAPLLAEAPITALTARHPGGWITASQDGHVIVHQILPPLAQPGASLSPPANFMVTPHLLNALDALVLWLGGGKPDPADGSIAISSIVQRADSPWVESIDVLKEAFPGCDFAVWVPSHTAMAGLDAYRDRSEPIRQRLARMRAPADLPSLQALQQVFNQPQSDQAVLDAIRSAGPSGPTAALALKHSLAVGNAEWLRACLAQAVGLPASLQRLAQARLAWAEGRVADAMSLWPEPPTDLARLRAAEDWDGWEQVDFAPEFAAFCRDHQGECEKLTLPAGADVATWQTLAERLVDPASAKTFETTRLARACLKVASHTPAGAPGSLAQRLIDTAARLGSAQPDCLRAAALAKTATGNYREARDHWIELITLHPVRCHQPSDYAEAAYTAFENSDPRQAMTILATGMHRFPDDARFALRAGWVALLTGNPQPAYRFLLAGQRIGYPPELRENATALLAVAAHQSGAPEDATAFFLDLVALSADWNQANTIDQLHWPDEMKAALKAAAGW